MLNCENEAEVLDLGSLPSGLKEITDDWSAT